VAKFKVVTPTGPTYGAKSEYALELEALRPLGAEIVEIDAKGEDDLVAAARDADALYAKGRKITKKIIDGLTRCRVISLGSVGVDSVDVAAATARGIAIVNDCKPYCAAGHFHRYAASVRAYRVRRCRGTGKYQYTRLRITATGRRKFTPRRFVQPFPC
jgi:hypothetical protein